VVERQALAGAEQRTEREHRTGMAGGGCPLEQLQRRWQRGRAAATVEVL